MTDKQLKDSLLGSTTEDNEQLEIIEICTKDRFVSIAGRTVVIENIENPFKVKARLNADQQALQAEIAAMQAAQQQQAQLVNPVVPELPPVLPPMPEPAPEEGLIPFALSRDYIDTSLIYGTGDVDLIRDQQELLNDLTELNIEAILYTIYPERSIDPKFASMIDDLNPAPGKVYPVPQGAITWNNPPAIPAHVFNERANIKSEIRETTAIDQVVKGITSPTNQTATEIRAQLGQSSQRIEMKAKNLENDFFLQVANICKKLISLYVTETTWVRTMSDNGVQFIPYDPSQFLGEYTPMVQLDITREVEKAREQQAYLEAYQMIIQDPTNNLSEAKKTMYPKMLPDLTQDQIDLIITPEAPPVVPPEITPELPPTPPNLTSESFMGVPPMGVPPAPPAPTPTGMPYLPPSAPPTGFMTQGGI